MYVYENYPKFSQTGLPLSEYAQMQVIKNLTTRLDWTSSRQKNKEEKLELSNAMLAHKKHSRSPYFREYRDELIKLFINSSAPNFGSFRLILG